MPLTEKGSEIKSNMIEEYGPEKGERVFYASKNKGTITGVDAMSGSTTPAPATPAVTTTTPPVTGVNTGITPGATTAPVTGDRVVRSVRELARDAGAVTPMPVDPVPPIANKAMGGVPVSKDAKPMSVRSLARMAGAGR